MTYERMLKKDRKRQILDAAIRVSEKYGYMSIFHRHVADELGISRTIIIYHFGTIEALRKEILKEAKKTNNLQILSQARSVNAIK